MSWKDIQRNPTWLGMRRVHELTQLVIEGKKTMQMVCSPPGLGKSEAVLETFAANKMKAHYVSPSSIQGLCADLWQHRDSVYLWDDCDTALRDEKIINLCKMAYGPQRLVMVPYNLRIERNEAWRQEGSDRYDPAVPPPTFRLGTKHGLITLANKNYADPTFLRETIRGDFSALISRGLDPLWIPSDLQSVLDYTIWLIVGHKMLLRHPQQDHGNRRGGFKLAVQQEVLDFICTNARRMTEISPRMAWKLAMARRDDPNYEAAWNQQLAPGVVHPALILPEETPRLLSPAMRKGAAPPKPNPEPDPPTPQPPPPRVPEPDPPTPASPSSGDDGQHSRAPVDLAASADDLIPANPDISPEPEPDPPPQASPPSPQHEPNEAPAPTTETPNNPGDLQAIDSHRESQFHLALSAVRHMTGRRTCETVAEVLAPRIVDWNSGDMADLGYELLRMLPLWDASMPLVEQWAMFDESIHLYADESGVLQWEDGQLQRHSWETVRDTIAPTLAEAEQRRAKERAQQRSQDIIDSRLPNVRKLKVMKSLIKESLEIAAHPEWGVRFHEKTTTAFNHINAMQKDDPRFADCGTFRHYCLRVQTVLEEQG